MDRFLMLNFAAIHDGEEIQTCVKDDKFIMVAPGHKFLIKRELDGSVLSTESIENDLRKIKITKYYPDGTLFSRGFAVNNKREGFYEEYFPSGNLAITCTFENGNLHGVETKFEETGNKLTEITYVHGVIHGYKKIYENNSLRFVCTFVNGENIKIQEYAPGPRLISESEIKNEKLHGEARIYHENGICKRLVFNYQGFFHGREICYDLRGKIHSTGNYYMGKKHGEFKYYNTLGNLTHIETYDNNVKI